MTIKPGVPHTNSVLWAGLWFVRLPLYKHLLLSLSSLIDWFISALMLEIESTLLSTAEMQGFAKCTDCILSSAVCVCMCVSHFHHECVKVHWLKLEGECKKRTKYASFFLVLPLFFTPPWHPQSRPVYSPLSVLCFSAIPHPLRGAREHAVEKTEPIKTLPVSILSLLLT